MAKWVILALGVLLIFNGSFTRTYSFENETPARHCFNMDYLGIDGCFGNTMAPALISWIPFLIGIALVVWAILHARRTPAA